MLRAKNIYPAFATHNALSVASVLEWAGETRDFEFQRLHGMGDGLYEDLVHNEGYHCRIYAPVGGHQDLLAYLVRRLLENGANSSFVHQLADEHVTD
jgi:RHH-type proline utilization regulon transcriptional repressor/proline dehydrogenase/delta 1-pyrroline-5-carboxylate dehydrogenase